MRYRIALCGFSEFECRALSFSLHQHATHTVGYDVVDGLSQADFAVVDADSNAAVKSVVLSGRVADAVFVGAAAPPDAGFHLLRPIHPNRILRMLDELSAQYPVPVRPVPVEPAAVYRLPILEDVVGPPRVALPPVAARAEPALTVAPPTVAPVPPVPPAAPGAAKAAARAAARRARLATSRTAPQTEPLRDVLVFDADDAASALLSALLERFGFRSHAVQSVDQADEQLETRPFAAFFLDIALDDADRGEGLALVRRIHQLAVPEGHPAPAVLMVTAHLNPADRVRASLAGIGALLLKPVTRGDAARALESCGVTLPADARRP